ncbi:hypothetical protein [Solicola sp. PLA-1-18]|uniref:hypothetical protein n=1 Tax=Solicola sp. PLA-1-18 TaxID=3380532 RepID=UPI003B7D019E
MIALTERPKVTSACQSWCARHDTTDPAGMDHVARPVTWTTTEGKRAVAFLSVFETPDEIQPPVVNCYVSYGSAGEQDDSPWTVLADDDQPEAFHAVDNMSLEDARTLADAINELLSATEAQA